MLLPALALGSPGVSERVVKRTVGSDLKGAPNPATGFGCGPERCVVQQTSLPGNPNPVRAPFTGVLRRWRYRTTYSGAVYEIALRVVRKVAPNRFRFIRHTPLGAIGPDPGVYSFGTSLGVRKGDFIALELPGGGVDAKGLSVGHPGAAHKEWYPVPAEGPVVVPDYSHEGLEFLYNATITRR